MTCERRRIVVVPVGNCHELRLDHVPRHRSNRAGAERSLVSLDKCRAAGDCILCQILGVASTEDRGFWTSSGVHVVRAAYLDACVHHPRLSGPWPPAG